MANCFIVGLAGPSNSGKTTLAREVAKRFDKDGYAVAVIEESVGKVFNKKWEAKYNSLYEIVKGGEYLNFQYDIFNTLRRDILNILDINTDIVITDRTFLDVLFYTITFAKESSARHALCSMCMEYLNFYDLIICLDRLEAIDNTGIRKSFIDLGKSYLGWEDTFFNLIIPISCKYIKIKNKDLIERIYATKRIILQEMNSNDKHKSKGGNN